MGRMILFSLIKKKEKERKILLLACQYLNNQEDPPIALGPKFFFLGKNVINVSLSKYKDDFQTLHKLGWR